MDDTTIAPHSYHLRRPVPDDEEALSAIWARSYRVDEPSGGFGGWGSGPWATDRCVVLQGDLPVGEAAIRYQRGARAASARLALLPEHRSSETTTQMLEAVVGMAAAAGAPLVGLHLPSRARWAIEPVCEDGFHLVRHTFRMLRPADALPLQAAPPEGVRIRPLREGEDEALLAALNRAWATTWNYQPITMEMLARDLRGQRAGMLVAVEEADERHIVGTCHAIFDPQARNPDGASPRAWISNLTNDPDWRGRGLGRALLAAGLTSLHERGARTVGLGVDGGNPVPVNLYRSAGFEVFATMEVWEREV